MDKPIIMRKSVIDETLSQTPAKGKHPLEPFTALAKEQGADLTILENHQIVNTAEAHRATVDFFYILEGEVEFVTGGRLVEPWAKELPDGSKNDLEIRAKSMEGGEVEKLEAGEMIWIPAGLSHTHRSPETTVRMLVIKVPSKEIAPLTSVNGWPA